ncbi:carboxypeptidase B2-like [Oncorhynchus nerka]|uniref:carboxypeptidase B2-like n=1 Tax=Oncorhynchus nerka TaxID=8023 RepID=UPI0011321DD2|nr:carboxypeptidase B2-like [Oncorhynchus nerka]
MCVCFRVLLDNTEELIEMQTRNESSDPRSSISYYDRYHSLEDIYYWINKTAQEHPDMIKVILIGSSYEKRPLYVLKLSGRQERAEKRAMWIDCGIHAREWISPAFCLWFVQYSLNFYHLNNDITEMLNSMDIYVLPVMNPDGYKYTWTMSDLAPGGSDDWAYNLGIHYSFTFELEDRGRYGFLLPPSFISKACNEALLALKSIALRKHNPNPNPFMPLRSWLCKPEQFHV